MRRVRMDRDFLPRGTRCFDPLARARMAPARRAPAPASGPSELGVLALAWATLLFCGWCIWTTL